MTAINVSDGRDLSSALAHWATRTTIVMTSAWIAILMRLTPPPTSNCRIMLPPTRLDARRQQVERHREDRIYGRDQRPDEPRRAAGIGHQRGNHRGDQHHGDRAGPELQIHRRRGDEVAEQHEHWRDEQRDL